MTKMRPPFVRVLDASDAEKQRYAYELAMFLYGIYKDEQNGDIIEMDKLSVSEGGK
jgi:hypothetical protein